MLKLWTFTTNYLLTLKILKISILEIIKITVNLIILEQIINKEPLLWLIISVINVKIKQQMEILEIKIRRKDGYLLLQICLIINV